MDKRKNENLTIETHKYIYRCIVYYGLYTPEMLRKVKCEILEKVDETIIPN